MRKLNNYPLYLVKKYSETIVVAIKILDLDPLQQYYHFIPFHKSTTLALKNFFLNAPFGFLNSLYMCVSTSIALLIQRNSSAVVFLVQWYLVGLLRLKLSLLCSLKRPSSKLHCSQSTLFQLFHIYSSNP